MHMSEKKKVLGFYGMVEFGDYLNGLNSTHHTFQIEDKEGAMMDCSRQEVLRQFEQFCGGDLDKFRVRVVHTDPQTGAKRNSDKILRRSKPARSRLTGIFSGLLSGARKRA
jgi:hypothetical protein